MMPQWLGLIAAAATFLGVWIGHVSVRKIEFISPNLWIPSLAALGLGLLLAILALLNPKDNVSAALGIFATTVLWDALEFWRQQHRVEKGHAPANPNNPRHRQILKEQATATTIDWLKRNPTGRRLSVEELAEIVETER